jgi:hypothetical protein
VPNFSSFQARWAGANWFHLDLPRHLFHFPVAALRRLLDETGFACQREAHFSLRQNPFGWIQSALNRSRSLPRNGLYHLLQDLEARGSPPFNWRTRTLLRLWFVVGALPALTLSLVAAAARSGATVQLVARKMHRE